MFPHSQRNSLLDHWRDYFGGLLPMSIVNMEISNLKMHCEVEINLFYRGQDNDACHCYELFRRCFQNRDQNAWNQIFILFEQQVTRWVRSHLLFNNSGEEASYFVNRAFEKIWNAIPPLRFEKFDNIKKILGYLKMCVNSAIVDHYRKEERSRLGIEKLKEQVATEETYQESNLTEGELWQLILELMKNNNECVILYASFILGLKPKEILVEYSKKFENINEIYQIKENILSRLRRSQELREFLREQENEEFIR